jgi:hypothetical protein
MSLSVLAWSTNYRGMLHPIHHIPQQLASGRAIRVEELIQEQGAQVGFGCS